MVHRYSREIEKPLRATLLRLAGGEDKWPLFLCGNVGTGKTCAALAFLDWVNIDYTISEWAGSIQVQTGYYATVDNLVQLTLANDEDTWRRFERADFAIVDELGLREKTGDLEYVSVKRAADARLYMPTIWISNHLPEKMREIYDERIYSRVSCGTWYKMEATGDRRMA